MSNEEEMTEMDEELLAELAKLEAIAKELGLTIAEYLVKEAKRILEEDENDQDSGKNPA